MHLEISVSCQKVISAIPIGDASGVEITPRQGNDYVSPSRSVFSPSFALLTEPAGYICLLPFCPSLNLSFERSREQ